MGWWRGNRANGETRKGTRVDAGAGWAPPSAAPPVCPRGSRHHLTSTRILDHANHLIEHTVPPCSQESTVH